MARAILDNKLLNQIHPMPKKLRPYRLYLVSVDFDTTISRPFTIQTYYNRLNKLLDKLGGVLPVTHQIKLLLTRHTSAAIRDRTKKVIRLHRDRIYVGRIATGSAWHNLLRVNNATLKAILKGYAGGVEPDKAEIAAARKAMRGLLP